MTGKIVVFAALGTLVALAWVPVDAAEQSPETEARRHAGGGTVHELVRHLEVLIGEAETANAADPRFLEDLRERIDDYEAASSSYLPNTVRDDFSDGDFTDDPRWIVAGGAFSVDPELGLRSVVRMPQAAAKKRIETIEDLAERAKGTLDDILGAREDVDVAAAAPEPAHIFTRAAVGNAFKLEVELSSRIALKGARLEIDVFQGITHASGYRLVYLPGSGQPVQLARFGRAGIKTLSKHVDELVLEDGYGHRLALERAADATMTVTVDGDEVIRIESEVLSGPFDGVAIVNSGGDYAIRRIALYSTL